METLEIATLAVVGWVAGAESGSWACVHPVIHRLPPEQQILFQQGLLKTFGRVMPVLMPLCLVLVISLCIATGPGAGAAFYMQLAAAITLATMIATTVLFNVPVNIATGAWRPDDYSESWQRKRVRWRFFQGYRSVALVISFLLLLAAR